MKCQKLELQTCWLPSLVLDTVIPVVTVVECRVPSLTAHLVSHLKDIFSLDHDLEGCGEHCK